MFNKTIYIVLISVFILIFSLTCVSAAQDNITNDKLNVDGDLDIQSSNIDDGVISIKKVNDSDNVIEKSQDQEQNKLSTSSSGSSIYKTYSLSKAPKFILKKATFKTKAKIKKYSITLKDGKKPIKKVKVYLKIGKKSFYAKTNNKGKATFKITKLTKKGTYTGRLVFMGNKKHMPTFGNLLKIKITKTKCKFNPVKNGFLDASKAYKELNKFRTQKGVWVWDEDGNKVYFNTNDNNKIKPLIRDVKLEKTAKIRAKEIAKAGYLSHTRPDGSSCFSIYPDNLYHSGENIALGELDGKQVTNVWKETKEPYSGQGHRRNMLGEYTHVGIAVYQLNGITYWVQCFGRYTSLFTIADS